jgi:ribosome modulation factor
MHLSIAVTMPLTFQRPMPPGDPAPSLPIMPASGGKEEAAVDDEFLEEGIGAFETGTPREACPYPASSDERVLWLAGWDEARSVTEEEMKDGI